MGLVAKHHCDIIDCESFLTSCLAGASGTSYRTIQRYAAFGLQVVADSGEDVLPTIAEVGIGVRLVKVQC